MAPAEDQATLFTFFTLHPDVADAKWNDPPELADLGWWWVGSGATRPVGAAPDAPPPLYAREAQYVGPASTQAQAADALVRTLRQQRLLLRFRVTDHYLHENELGPD